MMLPGANAHDAGLAAVAAKRAEGWPSVAFNGGPLGWRCHNGTLPISAVVGEVTVPPFQNHYNPNP